MGPVVLDSSALIAVLLHEPEAVAFTEFFPKAERLLLSAINYMETGIVWDNQATLKPNPADLDILISVLKVNITPVDFTLAQAARAAYRRYGKGRHPAKLNMGDCFSYALAKQMGVPLLYKGKDFAKTDVISAL